MSQDSINRLSQALHQKENRLDALSAIGKIESVDVEVAEELIDDLAYAVEVEANAYTVLQLLKEVKKISNQHPDIAIECAPAVAKLVNKALLDYQGDDPSENRKVNLGSEILEPVIDFTSSSGGSIPPTYQDVQALVQQGDVRRRVLGYRLLGRAATG